MPHARQRSAFVFAGGGSSGAVQVGMLRALIRAGVSADLVVGSSVGAMNAAYFASAPHAAEVDKLETVWRGMRRHDVFPVTFRSVLGFMGGADNLIDPSNLRRLIEHNIPFLNLEDAAIPVHVVATNSWRRCSVSVVGPRRRGAPRQRGDPGSVPIGSHRRTLSHRWRSREQHANTHRSRSGRHTYYRSPDGIRKRPPRAAEGSDRASFTCDNAASRPSNGARPEAAWRESRRFHRTEPVSA